MLGLVAIALGIYLPYALKAGWYYDDWDIYSRLQDGSRAWLDQLNACAGLIPGGRDLACLYHVSEYHVLGSHRTAYHLMSIGFVVLVAGLAYSILCRCRMPWQWAALAAGLVIVFPASDSTRLWPVAAVGQYVLALELGGALLALVALGRSRGATTVLLHAAAAAASLLAMVTYEIAVPLVALNVVLYWGAHRGRRALWRGALDLALVAGFLVYRLVLSPVDPNSGFIVHRDLGDTIARARVLLGSGWTTWHAAYLPGTASVVGIVALLAMAVALGIRRPALRRRLVPWGSLLVVSSAAIGACTLVFLTANDLYVPQVSGTFNRLNLPATAAYVVAFVALLGLGYEVVRAVVPLPIAASAAVALVLVGSGWHQLGIASDHKRAWEESWREQRQALAGYEAALRDVPSTSRIVGFDTPIWERGYVPVFAASWDLRGALDYTTDVDPPQAVPLVPAAGCGAGGIYLDGVLFMPYKHTGQPLFLVSPRRRAAVLVTSQRACDRVLGRWGRPPFWGHSVTG